MRFDVLLRKIKKQIPRVKGCTQCGQCCGPLICHTTELDKIRKYLYEHELWGVLKLNMDAHKAFQKASGVESCYLLKLHEGKSYCLAYPARPVVCRLFGVKVSMPCKNIEKVPFKQTEEMMLYYDRLKIHGVELNRLIELLCENVSL